MALIECPECGREISDKVKACPHCGYPMENNDNNIYKEQKVELTSVNLKPKNPEKTKKLLLILGGIAIVAIIAFAVIYLIKTNNEKEAYNTYVDNLNEVSMLMLLGGAQAESMNNLTAKVWRNSIYEESDSETDRYTKDNRNAFYDDFNDALGELFSDSNTKRKISELEENQYEVDAIMKELQNPPEGLENQYNTVTDLYSTYLSLTNLAINPSGSLQTFSESKNLKVDDFMDLYNKLEMQIPAKK